MTSGHQSLYDMVLRDFLLLAIFSSAVFSLTPIISTFQLSLSGESTIVTGLMVMHTIAFVSMNFHGGCLTIARLACMIDMNFMEETLGEKLVRNFSIVISLAAAIGSSCVQILKNEMNTGPIYFLITRQTIVSGKMLYKELIVLYFHSIQF
jgi:hypothetical protein